MFLNNPMAKKRNDGEIRKYFKLNENENIVYQNM